MFCQFRNVLFSEFMFTMMFGISEVSCCSKKVKISSFERTLNITINWNFVHRCKWAENPKGGFRTFSGRWDLWNGLFEGWGVVWVWGLLNFNLQTSINFPRRVMFYLPQLPSPPFIIHVQEDLGSNPASVN